MFKHTKRRFGVAVALLVAVALWGALLTGTTLAQSDPPATPGAGWHHGRMDGHMGYGMPATGTVTEPSPDWGWDDDWMGHSRMGYPMGYGVQATGTTTPTTAYGCPYMGYGMMGCPMGYGMGATTAATGTLPYGYPCGRWGHGMMPDWDMGSWSYPGAVTPLAPTASSGANKIPAVASLPENLQTALETADPARGQRLALSTGCIGCHSLDPRQRMVGPTWQNLAETAASRGSGESAESYLYQSITEPNAFVVPGYPANVMPPTYGQLLSDQDLADLIAYLLTLRRQ